MRFDVGVAGAGRIAGAADVLVWADQVMTDGAGAPSHADPSALVAADFRMSVFTLKDGRVLNGIIHAQTDRTITVSMVGQEVTVDRGDIVKQEQMPISMMPEGLVMALSDEQLRNLFAYLMGSSQVPLPGAQ